jgi:hypothetical protein
LFDVAADGLLTVFPVTLGETPVFGQPGRCFPRRPPELAGGATKSPATANASWSPGAEGAYITVVTNWQSLLGR